MKIPSRINYQQIKKLYQKKFKIQRIIKEKNLERKKKKKLLKIE